MLSLAPYPSCPNVCAFIVCLLTQPHCATCSTLSHFVAIAAVGNQIFLSERRFAITLGAAAKSLTAGRHVPTNDAQPGSRADLREKPRSPLTFTLGC